MSSATVHPQAPPARRPRWQRILLSLGQVMLAVAVVALGLALVPSDGGTVFLGGQPLSDTCPYLANTGHPCPSCGMSRSLALGARGDLAAAFAYSPAALTLGLWLVVSGVVAAARLVTGRFDLLRLPWQVTFGLTMAWLLLAWFGTWALRLLGVLDLPVAS